MRSLFRRAVAKFRDKLVPRYVFRVHTDVGDLPYGRGDMLGRRFWAGGFEQEERDLVRRLLRPGDIFIDAGANLGVYSLLASRACGPDGVVVSFEPSRVELRKLLTSLDWNHVPNVLVCPFALTDRPGRLTFFESLEGRGALNRLDRPAEASGRHRQIHVAGVSLDAFLPSIGIDRVDFIKIDVEGHELPLLQGAAGVLRKHRPTLLIEMADKRSSDRSTPQKVWAYLESLGYRWHEVSPAHGGLEPLAMPERFRTMNLFAIAGERVQEVATRAAGPSR